MSRAAVISKANRRPAFEPLYGIDPQTGARVEVFYCDDVLARSFGTRGTGWFHWSCRPGSLPEGPPVGPFPKSSLALRHALGAGAIE